MESTIPASIARAALRTPPTIPPTCDVVKLLSWTGSVCSGTELELVAVCEMTSGTRSAAVEGGSITLVVVHMLTIDPIVLVIVSVTNESSLSVRRQGASVAVAHI